MQFLVLGYDGIDEQAISRRLAVRQAHVALGDALLAKGNMLFGVAMLNSEGAMCGSMLVVDFPSRKELDAWLAVEPYVVGNVWERVEVMSCKIGPSFEHLEG